MSQITIAPSSIHNFSSVAQKRAYDQAQDIMRSATGIADVFLAKDETAADDNNGTPGSVLLDGCYLPESGARFTGLAHFDPKTKAIQSFSGREDTPSHTEMTFDDQDTCREIPGRAIPAKIALQSDSSVTYQTDQGLVRKTTDGTLFVDLDQRLNPNVAEV